jgi:hypothetical protein
VDESAVDKFIHAACMKDGHQSQPALSRPGRPSLSSTLCYPMAWSTMASINMATSVQKHVLSPTQSLLDHDRVHQRNTRGAIPPVPWFPAAMARVSRGAARLRAWPGARRGQRNECLCLRHRPGEDPAEGIIRNDSSHRERCIIPTVAVPRYAGRCRCRGLYGE